MYIWSRITMKHDNRAPSPLPLKIMKICAKKSQGHSCQGHITFGAMGDSYYEYLLKLCPRHGFLHSELLFFVQWIQLICRMVGGLTTPIYGNRSRISWDIMMISWDMWSTLCVCMHIYISECPKVPRASPRTSWFVELTELAGPNGQWKMDVTDKWIGFPGLYQPNIDMFCTCSLSETTVPKPEECYVLLNGLILGYRFGNALPS